MNSLRFILAPLIFFILCTAAPVRALASGPVEGVYAYVSPTGIRVEFTLTSDKNGNFTLRGTIVCPERPGLQLPGNITGVLKKSGKLLAKNFDGTNLNRASDIDGEWSEKDKGVRMIQSHSKFFTGILARKIGDPWDRVDWSGKWRTEGNSEFEIFHNITTGAISARTPKGTAIKIKVAGLRAIDMEYAPDEHGRVSKVHYSRPKGDNTFTARGRAIRTYPSGQSETFDLEATWEGKVEKVQFSGEVELKLPGSGFIARHNIELRVGPQNGQGESAVTGKVSKAVDRGYDIEIIGNSKAGRIRARGEMKKPDGSDYPEGSWVITLDAVYNAERKGYEATLSVRASDGSVNTSGKVFLK